MKMEKQEPIELVFVSGACGRLGKAVLLGMAGEKNRFCFGFQRHTQAVVLLNPPLAAPVEWWPCDIADFPAAAALIRKLISEKGTAVGKITLVHAIGPFKYEGYQKPDEAAAPDPHVMKMNYEAFVNMTEAVLDAVKDIGHPVQVNLCTFGSVSEKYKVPLWHSFNLAKQKVRDYIQFKAGQNRNIAGLYVRTSTIDTGSENKLRPHVPDNIRRYWLDPEKVAESVCADMEKLKPGAFEIKDIIEPMPGFDPEAYYRDVQKLDAHWRSMMPKPKNSSLEP